MKKAKSKPALRSSTVKQIIALVKKGDSSEAETIAKYGRPLSFAESFARHYYDALDEVQAAERGKTTCLPFPFSRREFDIKSSEEVRALWKKLQDKERCMAGILINAMNSHDSEMVMDLARAVSFFKDKRYPKFVAEDRERTILLCMKSLMERTGEKLTIRQVAQFLSMDELSAGKKLEVPADGFSALRRKCREINFPLAPLRKISKT